MNEVLVTPVDYLKEKSFEIVEKKGKGHPDTLADRLAEFLSISYSRHTKLRYGAILHHNFDKLSLLGGVAFVSFGSGYLTSPIRVVLNGRASTKFGRDKIPVRELLIRWTKKFLKRNLYGIDPNRDLRIIYELSNQSSPGNTYSSELIKESSRRFWFEPRGLEDLPELKKLFSNDTSLGVGYFPPSPLERFVVLLENYLTSENFKRKNPWIGTDIKIMAIKLRGEVFLTLCVPQIADFVSSCEEYNENKKMCLEIIKNLSVKEKINLVELNINTRDKEKVYEIYLTATGSSIESGDEGVVGRGNRITGLISPTNPYSMEGICGKNPVYHIGKLYYLAAQLLSKEIYYNFKIKNQVFLASQSGRNLLDPWIKVVLVPSNTPERIIRRIKHLSKNFIKDIPLLTEKILLNKFKLC